MSQEHLNTLSEKLALIALLKNGEDELDRHMIVSLFHQYQKEIKTELIKKQKQ